MTSTPAPRPIRARFPRPMLALAALVGVGDQGQISKLLHRLERGGLIENTGAHASKGTPKAWTATEKGHAVQRAIQAPRESDPKGRTQRAQAGRQALRRMTDDGGRGA
jgi:DNA-binding PadR family transcriptional regulator